MELISSYHSSDESLSDIEIPPATKKTKPCYPNTQQIFYNDTQQIFHDPPSKSSFENTNLETSCTGTLATLSDDGLVAEPVLGAYVSKRKPIKHCINHVMDNNMKSPKLDEYLTVQSKSLPYCTRNRVSTNISLKWKGHIKPIESLQWHPIHPELLLSAGFDGFCKIWNMSENDNCLSSFVPHSNQAVSTAKWLSPSTVVSGGYDCSVVNTDYIAMKKNAMFAHNGHVTALKPHPFDPNLFVSGDASKNVQLWDIRMKKNVSKYIGAGGRILDVEFINKGAEIIASCDVVRKNAGSKMLLVWDTSMAIIRSHQIYDEPYTCPCLKDSPINNTFLAQSNANYIIIFNACKPYKMNKYKRFEGHLVNGYKTQFDISSDGSLLCTGSADGKLNFFHHFSTKPLKTITISSSPLIAVTWHPSLSSKLACSLWNGTITVLE